MLLQPGLPPQSKVETGHEKGLRHMHSSLNMTGSTNQEEKDFLPLGRGRLSGSSGHSCSILGLGTLEAQGLWALSLELLSEELHIWEAHVPVGLTGTPSTQQPQGVAIGSPLRLGGTAVGPHPGRVAIEAEADLLRVATVSCQGPGTGATCFEGLPLPQDVAANDLAEGLAELADAVGIDEGIHHGIGVGEDDGQVHEPGWGVAALGTEEGEAVDDVQGQPAEGEEPHNDGQRLGSVDLLLQRGPGSLPRQRLALHLLQLSPGCQEDPQVDTQHEKQGHQDTSKEVVVHHVVHGDHVLKETGHLAHPAALRVVSALLLTAVVPA